MNISKFTRKLKAVITGILTPILVCFMGLTLTACTPQDIKYDEAIEIAKKDFGCEKILWIEDNIFLSVGIPTVYELRSHYAFYVVGEKDGQEIYIVIPSTPELDEPYITTWSLDYTFAQVVDKFNENGAHYVADVPDDYYNTNPDGYIKLETIPDHIKGKAEYY